MEFCLGKDLESGRCREVIVCCRLFILTFAVATAACRELPVEPDRSWGGHECRRPSESRAGVDFVLSHENLEGYAE